MRRPPFLFILFGFGVAFMRGLGSMIAPGVLLRIVRVRGVEGASVDPFRGGGPLVQVAVLLTSAWGLLVAGSLVAALWGVGVQRAWARPALGVWVAVGTVESVVRVVALPFVAHAFPDAVPALTGADSCDDVCCCLPISTAWLITAAVWLARRS